MLKTFLSAFGLVFIAELGDKTQLATMLLAAQGRSPYAVFLGSAAALVASSLVGVLAGAALTRIVPESLLRTGAGILFVTLGILLLLRKL